MHVTDQWVQSDKQSWNHFTIVEPRTTKNLVVTQPDQDGGVDLDVQNAHLQKSL